MKTFSFVIAISITLTAAAFGRIGDDEKQIESLYGKAAKVLNEKGSLRQVGYTAGAFAVMVDFVNGISRREGFAKPDTSMLTPQDIEQILSVSAAEGMTWKEAPGQAGDKKWNRSDNKAVAIFPGRQTLFIVQDVAYVQTE